MPTLTPVANGVFRYNLRMGENTQTATMPMYISDPLLAAAAVSTIGEIVDDISAGRIMSVTRAYAINTESGTVPPDLTAKLRPVAFNFLVSETGATVSALVPFPTGITELNKGTFGTALATALSGDLGTLIWVS